MESISRLAEQPANLGGCLSGCGLLALTLERPERGDEEGLVDSTLEDRHIHLDALGEHIAPLHVQLVGQLRGRQVNGHIATPLLLNAEMPGSMYIASGRRVNHFFAISGGIDWSAATFVGAAQIGFGTSTNSWPIPKRSATSS